MEYEQFPVYKMALEFVNKTTNICKEITKREYFFIKDQLMRASSSIVLNIAEGAGRWTKGDKIRFYRISRGSTCECRAAIDLFVQYKLINEQYSKYLKEQLYEIYCGLNNLMSNISKRKI